MIFGPLFACCGRNKTCPTVDDIILIKAYDSPVAILPATNWRMLEWSALSKTSSLPLPLASRGTKSPCLKLVCLLENVKGSWRLPGNALPINNHSALSHPKLGAVLLEAQIMLPHSVSYFGTDLRWELVQPSPLHLWTPCWKPSGVCWVPEVFKSTEMVWWHKGAVVVLLKVPKGTWYSFLTADHGRQLGI